MSLFSRLRLNRALAALSKSQMPVLRHYADADWPVREMPANEAPLLALDFELDGLRKGAHLLQAGWTPFIGRAITLEDACSLDIRSDASLDRTAVTVHGIGEQRAAQGLPVGEVVELLLRALAGRVLVAHAAFIEVDAIREVVRSIYGVALPVRSICTMTLERHIHPRLMGAEDYRLANCRSRYGLPEYRAHDALTDAIAAAELLQAQLTRLPSSTTLGQIETH